MLQGDALAVQLFIAATGFAVASLAVTQAGWTHKLFVRSLFIVATVLVIGAVFWRPISELAPRLDRIASNIATNGASWFVLITIALGLIFFLDFGAQSGWWGSSPREGRSSATNGAIPTESNRFRYFPPPDQGYHRAFYEYFIEKLDAANHQIYVTGEGFSCLDEAGVSLAHNFHNAIKRALRRNVAVVRIQLSDNTSHQWAQMLSELLEEFPSRFDLFVIREKRVADVLSMCVLDPESPQGCLVEMMISSHSVFGTKPTEIAGPAMFFANQRLAQDLRARILEMARPDVSIHLTSSTAAREFLEAKQLYFAYGSNMSTQQMEQRVRHPKRVGIGFIRDYKLVFNRRGTYRPGGVASIAPTPGERTYGVVWQIPSSEFKRLDETEDTKAYERITLDVLCPDGRSLPCQVYKAFPEGHYDPDPEYLVLLLEAARKASLPSEYIAALEAHRSL